MNPRNDVHGGPKARRHGTYVNTTRCRVHVDADMKFGRLVLGDITDARWLEQLKAKFPLKTSPLGAKNSWICLICGTLNFQSKKRCTGFNCWATSCPRAVLEKHTNWRMRHTQARQAIIQARQTSDPRIEGGGIYFLRKMPIHFVRLDLDTVEQTGPLPCRVCGQAYLFNPKFCPCVWTPPMPMSKEG